MDRDDRRQREASRIARRSRPSRGSRRRSRRDLGRRTRRRPRPRRTPFPLRRRRARDSCERPRRRSGRRAHVPRPSRSRSASRAAATKDAHVTFTSRADELAHGGHRRVSALNTEVFITCAVTGAGATTERSELVPVTPAQIADAAIEAARAGAAIAHVHVRDPETGGPSRDTALYREVVERIRGSGVDVVLNLTAGMGGDLVLGGVESPLPPSPEGTDMAGATERLEHVARAATGDLHARLRDDELRGGRLRDDEHALDAARDGAADPRPRRPPGDRGLRHGPPRVREAAHRRGPRRRAGDAAALHGDPVRGARRPGDAARARQPAARRLRLLRVRDRPHAARRTSRSRRSSAATCASGSRTTSGSSAA